MALVQNKAATGTSTSPQATLDSTPTNGNLLIATIGCGATVANLDANTGWTMAVEVEHPTISMSTAIAYKVAGAGESATQVPFQQVNSVNWSVEIEEWSGMAASPLDKTNSNPQSGTGTSVQPGSTGTLTQASEVVVTVSATNGSNGAGEAIDSGFTVLDAATFTQAISGYLAVSATTALNPTHSWNTSRPRIAAIATFKVSTGGSTFTGTAAQTLPAFTQAAAGTFTKPTYSGVAAQTLASLTQAAAGTFTKPTFTAASAQTLPVVTQSAAGTTTVPTFTGTAAQTLPALTQTAAGTVTSSTFTGSAAQTLPAVTQSADGTFTPPTFTGTTAQTLPAVTQSATGTTTDTYTGVIAQTLPALGQSATGAFTQPVFTGTAVQTLPLVVQTAAGTVTVPTYTGSIASTLQALTQAAEAVSHGSVVKAVATVTDTPAAVTATAASGGALATVTAGTVATITTEDA